MKQLKYISLFLFTVISLLCSCHKFPEDEGISLKPPKKRIEGKWYLEQYLINDQDSMQLFLDSAYVKERSYDINYDPHKEEKGNFDGYFNQDNINRSINEFYYFEKQKLHIVSWFFSYYVRIDTIYGRLYTHNKGIYNVLRLDKEQMILEQKTFQGKKLKLVFKKK